ncbi:MAG: hypothetical protein ACFFD2_09845 [Promethearchaeota archaeon]
MNLISGKQQIDLQQLKNEMLTELRQLYNILGRREYRQQPRTHQVEKKSISRNYKEITKILEEYGIFYDIGKKIAVVSKKDGNFFINLLDGTVKFSPTICLKCTNRKDCKKTERKICIVGDSEGWANFKLAKIDMLILSKIFALFYDLLPNHILKQIKTKSHCFIKESKIIPLDDCIFQELDNLLRTENSLFAQAPPIQGPIPPPKFHNLNLQFNPLSKQIKHSSKSQEIIELKNIMLKELKRLKELMNISKCLSKSIKQF